MAQGCNPNSQKAEAGGFHHIDTCYTLNAILIWDTQQVIPKIHTLRHTGIHIHILRCTGINIHTLRRTGLHIHTLRHTHIHIK